MSEYDVAVVGAGPAGSFLAFKLSQAGFKVVLLESKKEIGRKVCGEYLCPLGYKLLERNGLSDYILNEYQPILGMKIYSPSQNMVQGQFVKNKKINYAVSLHRKKFDSYLVDLAKKNGVEVRFDNYLKGAEFKDDQWILDIKNKDRLSSKLLIGADGRRSKVAQVIDVDQHKITKRVAVHCYVKPQIRPERYGEMHIFDCGSYLGLDPITDNEINFSLVCDGQLVKKYESTVELLNDYINKSDRLKSLINTIPDNQEIFVVTNLSSKVSQVAGGNWGLIGDASGFVDPLTGEGIYKALHTADILAEKLIYEKKLLRPNYERAFRSYSMHRKRQFRDKTFLNNIFQWLIKKPKLVNFVAKFINKKTKRSDILVGIIGNLYSPFLGLFKMI